MNTACIRTSIEDEVLREIKPREADYEKVSSTYKLVREAVASFLHMHDAAHEVELSLEGSFAKDTWLRDDVDLDIFLLAKRDCSRYASHTFIEKLAEFLAARGFRVEQRYAQHPYLTLVVNELEVDVVPACSIEDPARPLTAVDRTPYHRRYVTSKLVAEQKDEVRLLKSFMKGIGVYGAEVSVKGFSGYVAELLVVFYGCFRKVLEAASSWRPPVVIDIEGYYSSRREVLEKFGKAPVIVVDPTDPNRNAAAAVSIKSLASFVMASKLYLRNPSIEFFHIARRGEEDSIPRLEDLNQRVQNVVLVEVAVQERIPRDNLWGILDRIRRIATNILENEGFRVFDSGTYLDDTGVRGIIAIEVEQETLPPYEKLKGPPPWSEPGASQFYEKYTKTEPDSIGPWIDHDGRLVVIRRRRHRRASETLTARLPSALPKSAQSLRIKVGTLKEALQGGLTHGEAKWLREFIAKAPKWIRKDA
ncbi:MAG: CCA tRNA nucleotidyltransferase [Thermoproteota archaeon]